MMRSGTMLEARNSAVVVAKDPMPSVSKKFVTAPMQDLEGCRKPRVRRWRRLTRPEAADRCHGTCPGGDEHDREHTKGRHQRGDRMHQLSRFGGSYQAHVSRATC